MVMIQLNVAYTKGIDVVKPSPRDQISSVSLIVHGNEKHCKLPMIMLQLLYNVDTYNHGMFTHLHCQLNMTIAINCQLLFSLTQPIMLIC